MEDLKRALDVHFNFHLPPPVSLFLWNRGGVVDGFTGLKDLTLGEVPAGECGVGGGEAAGDQEGGRGQQEGEGGWGAGEAEVCTFQDVSYPN